MVYFDNNACAPISPYIKERIQYYSELNLVNPSSAHSAGRFVKGLLEDARRRISQSLGDPNLGIVFTSSGTESINHAIKSCYYQHNIKKVLTSNLEHAATEEVLKWLEKKGVQVTRLDAKANGAVTVEQLEEVDFTNFDLIIFIAANNETGVKSPINKIASSAHRAQVPCILDCVAWLGKDKLTIPEGVTYACFSGHKVHAPAGIGVLAYRDKLLQPLIHGGHHELGYRGGTPNVLGALLFADALEDFSKNAEFRIEHMKKLRNHFESSLKNKRKIEVNGFGERVSNVSNLYFPGLDGEELLMYLDLNHIYTSLGSACSSGSIEPSRILLNMGRNLKEALCCMRFSFSYLNTFKEVDIVAELILNK